MILLSRYNSKALVFFLLLLLMTGWAQERKGPPTVVFMTDFGTVDDSVAICRGVMYGIEPELRIVDLSHQVPPFAVADGARFLYGATPYYAAGTVFVVVIDPSVGSNRKAIVAKSGRGQYFVLPDNGLMTMVQDRDGIEEVHEITNRKWMLGEALSSTFHGRDIFSPVGAHLACSALMLVTRFPNGPSVAIPQYRVPARRDGARRGRRQEYGDSLRANFRGRACGKPAAIYRLQRPSRTGGQSEKF